MITSKNFEEFYKDNHSIIKSYYDDGSYLYILSLTLNKSKYQTLPREYYIAATILEKIEEDNPVYHSMFLLNILETYQNNLKRFLNKTKHLISIVRQESINIDNITEENIKDEFINRHKIRFEHEHYGLFRKDSSDEWMSLCFFYKDTKSKQKILKYINEEYTSYFKQIMFPDVSSPKLLFNIEDVDLFIKK